MPLQIADDRAIAVTALPGPVVDTDRPRGSGRLQGMAANDTQQGVLADRQEQTLGEILSWSPTQRQTKMMNNAFQTRCSARVRAGSGCVEPLGKGFLTALSPVAAKPADPDPDRNPPPVCRQIRQRALIATVDLHRRGTAGRTGRGFRGRPRHDHQPTRLGFNVFNGQPRRRQRNTSAHDGNPPSECRSCSHRISPTLRQSPVLVPIDTMLSPPFLAAVVVPSPWMTVISSISS